jgi:hypothetical protein
MKVLLKKYVLVDDPEHDDDDMLYYFWIERSTYRDVEQLCIAKRECEEEGDNPKDIPDPIIRLDLNEVKDALNELDCYEIEKRINKVDKKPLPAKKEKK